MPFHKGIQFLDAELVSCHPSVALHYGIPQLREGKPTLDTSEAVRILKEQLQAASQEVV